MKSNPVQTPPAKKNAPTPAEKAAAAIPVGAMVELEVWFAPPVNHRLLICHVPGAEGSDPTQLVSVAVRDNRNFLRKMRLNARKVSEKRFDFEGAMPRRKGVW